MLLFTSIALVAFTVTPLSMAPPQVHSQVRSIPVRMEDAPKADAAKVKESTPESKAAAKAAYEANKAKREVRYAAISNEPLGAAPPARA